MDHPHDSHQHPSPKKRVLSSLDAASGAFIDPVCGMTVNPAKAAGSFEYQGTTYYFCARRCLERFREDPDKFLAPKIQPATEEKPGAQYTCPMHPEIVQTGPGSCPKCGMALEPMEPTSAEETNHELKDLRWRFWLGLALSLPVFALAMADMIPGLSLGHLDMAVLNYVQLALATPVVWWCGWIFFQRAFASIVHRSPNMFTLIALGVGAAYFYSLAATLFPRLFPDDLQKHGGVEAYFDTAATVTVLVLLGQLLEARARGHTSAAIKKLLGLAPKTARLVGPDGAEREVPLELVQPGDLLRVRPGERVPVDGTVREGRSSVDESMISGEPIPVVKEHASPVIGGTINGAGSFLMAAERVGKDSLLAQIVRLVGEAQRSRAPIQRLVDQVSAYFVPAVLLIAIATFFGWLFLGSHQPALAAALVNAVAVLVIACPCALGLATPMAIMVGTGKGAENGILIKDAEALETLHRVQTLVFDKTGTLTEGKPRVTEVEPANRWNSADVLRLAASLEQASEHPLARAFLTSAAEQSLPLVPATNVQSLTGLGIEGDVEGRHLLLGTPRLFADRGIDVAASSGRLTELRQRGRTAMLVAVDGQFAGIVAVTDPIRATTPEAIRDLRALGLELIVLTGDSRETAEAVARELGLERVIAEVLPQDKSKVIAELRKQGKMVAMVGDGVNDAPALAQADIGIALATGSDIAMESAGLTLVHGDLRAIVRARLLSAATLRNIKQNLVLAFAYNVLCLPVAAFGFISPVWASAAMSLSSLSVVGNALRLRRQKVTVHPSSRHP